MANRIDNQRSLTEDLQVLEGLALEKRPPSLNFDSEDLYAGEITLTILDTVALFLSTGRPDGAIAVFYRSTDNTLYLAKSSPVDSGDKSAVTSLLDELKTATSLQSLLPFLASRSSTEVNRRLQKCRQAILEYHEDLVSTAKEYTFASNTASPDFEFPHSQQYLTTRYPNAIPSCKQILDDLLQTCQDLAPSNLSFNNTEENKAKCLFYLLAVKTLLLSRFFCQYTETQVLYTEELMDSLVGACQYFNIDHVIRFWSTLKTAIKCVWVPSSMGQTCHPHGPSLVVKGRLQPFFQNFSEGRCTRLTEEIMKCMDLSRPEWRRKDESASVQLSIHPEIGLVLYLMNSISQDAKSEFEATPLYIGRNTRSCFCCLVWINAFNEVTRMRWIVYPSKTNMQADWAFPETDIVEDKIVSEAVRSQLTSTLWNLRQLIRERLWI